MAYLISHFFPGGTRDQYETAMVALNGTLGVIPEGQILHVAGPVPGGFHVVAVQESKESWDAFLNDRFIPAMTKGIPGGFMEPPVMLEFETSHDYE